VMTWNPAGDGRASREQKVRNPDEAAFNGAFGEPLVLERGNGIRPGTAGPPEGRAQRVRRTGGGMIFVSVRLVQLGVVMA